jgi:hypothetical protein
MSRPKLSFMCCVALLLFGSTLHAPDIHSQESSGGDLAVTPPMGWNSWDGYGTTIGESAFKANVDWLALHLKSYGWQYVIIDADWFVTNPVAEGNSKTFHYVMDDYGRYVPPPSRFPSAAGGLGFKPLADYVHALGLKFGIHLLRGIPKEAVRANLRSKAPLITLRMLPTRPILALGTSTILELPVTSPQATHITIR